MELLQKTEIEPGWTLEYYFVDHEMWVREDRHGVVREMPVSDYLLQSHDSTGPSGVSRILGSP